MLNLFMKALFLMNKKNIFKGRYQKKAGLLILN